MIESVILLIILGIGYKVDFGELSYRKLDDFIIRYENKLGVTTWAVIIGVVFLISACIYVRPDTHCGYLGRYYAELAANPFAWNQDNPVAFRILTPLISYVIGLRGCSIIFTNLIISACFIALVYGAFRKLLPRPGDAFLSAAILTFSLPILTVIHCGGYCDVLTYLIVFLMWFWRRKRILFFPLFLIGLLNRESIVFLIPWFTLIYLESEKRGTTKIVEVIFGFGMALGLYYIYRTLMASQMNIEYTITHYFEPFLNDPMRYFMTTFYYHGLGLFSVFKALWIFPILAAVSFWKRKEYYQIFGMALLLLGSYAQLFIAQDTSRMFTLSFMLMFIALYHLLSTDFLNIRKFALGALAFNLLIPQVYTAGHKVEVWQSLTAFLLSGQF